MTYEVADWHWDGDDMVVTTKCNKCFVLHKPWPASVRYEGLDYDDAETCNIRLTQRYRTFNAV